MPKDCGSLQRTRKARTFVSREVFFATYTPRQKTLKLSFAAAAAKLCEAHTFRFLVGAAHLSRPLVSPINSNLSPIQNSAAISRGAVGLF